jgi:hypothetical protein
MTEVYGLVVILVICVIFNEGVLWIMAGLISQGLSGNI